MKQKTTKWVIGASAGVVIAHATYKLSQSAWKDWQHWAVLVAGLLILYGAYTLKRK